MLRALIEVLAAQAAVLRRSQDRLWEDEFINFNGQPEDIIRRTYKRVYDAYCPGPVMKFDHWPDNFEYFDPNPNDGAAHNVKYGGPNWRAKFASAGAPLAPGSERFTLDKVGAEGMASMGAMQAVCGAKKLVK